MKEISCLTVTQPSHIDTLPYSIRDFARQNFARKELVIVHDGSEEFHLSITALADRYPDEQIVVKKVTGPRSLGALRNIAVDAASGDLICQWDDDDRYHSERLMAQYTQLVKQGCDFCFLTDQLHLFSNTCELFWDNWNLETFPMNLIQGSIMGRRAQMPIYPQLDRGEDTPVVLEIIRKGCRVAELTGHGYLYLYVYNGKNTWNFQHHGEISAWKRYRQPQLEQNIEQIRRALKDYDLMHLPLKLPYDGGCIIVNEVE